MFLLLKNRLIQINKFTIWWQNTSTAVCNLAKAGNWWRCNSGRHRRSDRELIRRRCNSGRYRRSDRELFRRKKSLIKNENPSFSFVYCVSTVLPAVWPSVPTAIYHQIQTWDCFTVLELFQEENAIPVGTEGQTEN